MTTILPQRNPYRDDAGLAVVAAVVLCLECDLAFEHLRSVREIKAALFERLISFRWIE